MDPEEPQSEAASAPGSAAEELVRRTASLARLEVSDEEVVRLAPQFASILEAFETISRLDLESGRTMTRPGGDRPRTRPDEERPSLPVDSALANAPHRVDDFYSVPRAIPASPEGKE